MHNDKLKYVLKNTKLDKCEVIVDNYLYYIKKNIRNGSCFIKNCEFIIIAENEVKQAIIYNMADQDLHWYVLEEWREKHVLSNALRTDVIKQVWPDVKTITCCYEYGENYKDKLNQTKHLAKIAGLKIKKEPTTLLHFN